MTLSHEIRDALESHSIHADIREVIEETAERRAFSVDWPGDGSLLIRPTSDGPVAATVHPSQMYLPLDPSLVRQVRDDIGWSVTGRSAHHVTIRAEDLLGPTAQQLAVRLLDEAILEAFLAPPPAAPAPRRTTSASPRTTTPRAPRKATPAKPVIPERPAAAVCPTCFTEMLGGECVYCD